MARISVLEKRGADYRIIEIGDFLARAVTHFRDDRQLMPQALILEVRRKAKAKGYESLTPEQKKIHFCVPLLD
jgi:hypothetical protein